MPPRPPGLIALGLLLAAITAQVCWGAPAASPATAALARGAAYLIAAQQSDGSWEHHAGITAVAVLALAEPLVAGQPGGAGQAVGRGTSYLERWVQRDGGIYQPDHQEIKHYTTAVALLAFAASPDPRHAHAIAGARTYLLRLQAREDKGFGPSHPAFGGTLIDESKANLDATFFAMRALAAAGLPEDDPYWARALRFVTRCQNWKPTNDLAWAGTDGGFVFAPGFSFAGGTTSYGSMTYAGLSAYRDASLPQDDERVEAALRWVGAHFTTRENPGIRQQTLYHSYFYLADALRRWRISTFRDAGGRMRAWRRELAGALLERQRPDGSWANAADPRWWENQPVLATSLAVRALAASLDGPRD